MADSEISPSSGEPAAFSGKSLASELNPNGINTPFRNPSSLSDDDALADLRRKLIGEPPALPSDKQIEDFGNDPISAGDFAPGNTPFQSARAISIDAPAPLSPNVAPTSATREKPAPRGVFRPTNAPEREAAAARSAALRDSPAIRVALEVINTDPDLKSSLGPILARRTELIDASSRPGQLHRLLTPLLVGIELNPRSRDVLQTALDLKVDNDRTSLMDALDDNNFYVHELVVGAGVHSAIYNSERQAIDPAHPALTTDANQRIGGQFAQSERAVWQLNSRTRPEDLDEPHLPGTKGSLNTMGRSVVQESDMSGQAYSDQAKVADAVRLNHLVASRIVNDFEFVGARRNPDSSDKGKIIASYRDKDTGAEVDIKTDRLIISTGLGESTTGLESAGPATKRTLSEAAQKYANGEDPGVFTNAQWLAWAGDRSNPMPLRGIKTLAIGGRKDSGTVADGTALGYEMPLGLTVANLDRVEKVYWFGQTVPSKEQFIATQRQRYARNALDFPREAAEEYYARIEPIGDKITAVEQAEDGSNNYQVFYGTIGESVMVDHAVLATGYKDTTNEKLAGLIDADVAQKYSGKGAILGNIEQILSTPGTKVTFATETQRQRDTGYDSLEVIDTNGVINYKISYRSQARSAPFDTQIAPTTPDERAQFARELFGNDAFPPETATLPAVLSSELIYAKDQLPPPVESGINEAGREIIAGRDAIDYRLDQILATRGATLTIDYPEGKATYTFNGLDAAGKPLFRLDYAGSASQDNQPFRTVDDVAQFKASIESRGISAELPPLPEPIINKLGEELIFDEYAIRQRIGEVLATPGATLFGREGNKEVTYAIKGLSPDGSKVIYDIAFRETGTRRVNETAALDRFTSYAYANVDSVQLPAAAETGPRAVINDPVEIFRRTSEFVNTPGTIFTAKSDSSQFGYIIGTSSDPGKVSYQFIDKNGEPGFIQEVGREALVQYLQTLTTEVTLAPGVEPQPAGKIVTDKAQITSRINEFIGTPGALITVADRGLSNKYLIDAATNGEVVSYRLVSQQGDIGLIARRNREAFTNDVRANGTEVQLPPEIGAPEAPNVGEVITDEREILSRATELARTIGAVFTGTSGVTNTIVGYDAEFGSVMVLTSGESKPFPIALNRRNVQDFLLGSIEKVELPGTPETTAEVPVSYEVISDQETIKSRAAELAVTVGAKTFAVNGRQETVLSVEGDTVTISIAYTDNLNNPSIDKYSITDQTFDITNEVIRAEIPRLDPYAAETITDRDTIRRRAEEIINTIGAEIKSQSVTERILSIADGRVTFEFGAGETRRQSSDTIAGFVSFLESPSAGLVVELPAKPRPAASAQPVRPAAAKPAAAQPKKLKPRVTNFFDRPDLLADADAPIAVKYGGLEVYRIGAGADIPLTGKERAALRGIADNTDAIFLRAPKDAALAHYVSAIDAVSGGAPEDAMTTRPEARYQPVIVSNAPTARRDQTEFTRYDGDYSDRDLRPLPVDQSAADLTKLLVGDRFYNYQFPADLEAIDLDIELSVRQGSRDDNTPIELSTISTTSSISSAGSVMEVATSDLVADPTFLRVIQRIITSEPTLTQPRYAKLHIPLIRGTQAVAAGVPAAGPTPLQSFSRVDVAGVSLRAARSVPAAFASGDALPPLPPA